MLADANNTTILPDWVSVVQAGGTAGLILALLACIWAFITGRIISGSSHVKEIDAKDKRITALETDLQATSLFVRDQLMPLLTRTQDVLTKTLQEQAWRERHNGPT